ncbi:SdrD B-like domain-containing protein [Nitratifractor salsuginis]|uniref:Cna B domain protein n=1 Tax=Nitratifractor salsuginis (strain DSM 16511 / JCM 12458 / E9I37-1) TaxID=749222 RepID=E6WY62_NITSE|nr:SdrD B-like domain-containing protein [Nitratifractor salsuginis]ADV45310.1 Cna B domain protein [Nitratifractor salsuginis DSM 16511]
MKNIGTGLIRFFSVHILFIMLSITAYAGVSGTVWRDLPLNGSTTNVYGVKEANELGVAGVTVTAYPGGQSTTTAADGTWSLPTTGDVRIEFSAWPDYLEESPSSTVQNSSVRFARDGDTVNFALHDQAEYCTVNPDLASVLIINGGLGSNKKSIVTFPYDSEGILTGSGTTYNGTQRATNVDVGSVWGLAYSRTTNKLYSATFLKRHVALKGNLGDIRITDLDSNTTSLFYTIPNAGDIPSNDERGVNVGDGDPSHDNDVFSDVGKKGLGGIDISPDEKYLYVVNLNDKKLYTIEIDSDNDPTTNPSSSDVSSVAIPDPGCTNGEWRPFGLRSYHNELYIGGICDASSGGDVQYSSDLRAVVYRYDGTNFSSVLDFPLNYHKVSLWDETVDENNPASYWHPWVKPASSTTNHTEPLLSDIEFDIDGSMILAFSDRFGHQIGHKNYWVDSDDTLSEAVAGGDVLRACLDNGTYVLESNGVCGGVTGAGAGRNSGPADGGDYGEFYDDRFSKNSDTNGHSETSNGAVAILAGSGQLVLNSMDPVDWDGSGSDQDYFRAGGPAWFNNSGPDVGKKTRGYHLFRHRDYNQVGWAKGAGLGDIELLCPPAPIEIGNRVWLDTDADGVQDAGEAGIKDVTVELLDENGNVIATATTDENGSYIFSNDLAGSSTESHKYNVTDLHPNKTYTIRIPNVSGGNKQTALGDYSLTKANTGEGTNTNLNDSDSVANGDNADAQVLPADIPISGANNHSFDFGFSYKMSIGSYVWTDTNRDGLQGSQADEPPLEGAVVTLLADDGNGNFTAVPGRTVTTGSDGLYYFGGLPEGNYKVQVAPPSGLVPSPIQNTADNDDTANDSNIKERNETTHTYTSGMFTLTESAEVIEAGNMPGDDADNSDDSNGNMTIDFGFVPVVSIGSTVFYDNNNNGLQDAGEAAIPGVTVNLYRDADADGHPDGAAIKTMQTDDEGNYFFDNLEPGHYVVGIVPPADAPTSSSPAVTDTHDDQKDGDDNGIQGAPGEETFSPSIELRAGDEPVNEPAQGGDQETGPDANGDMTVDFGFVPFVSVGSLVWYDANNNGKQDAGESGIKGATVELLDANGNPVTVDGNGEAITPVTTDSDGKYCFCNLLEGDYTIKVTPPAGYTPSTTQQADANTDTDDDSNIATDNGDGSYTSGTVELRFKGEPENETSPIDGSDTGCGCPVGDKSSNATVDFGFYIPQVSLGSVVWVDTNDNGIQDADETGVEGATVQLLDQDGNPVTTDANGNAIATITTAASGNYYFGNLPEGNYTVKVTPPAGFRPSTTQVADPNNDVAGDSNIATRNSDGSYTSGVIELTNNSEPEGAAEVSALPNNGDDADDAATPIDDTADNNGNMTLDFGFVPFVSVGSLVWYDANNNGKQDAGESGIKGATVELLDANGNPVTVDGNGEAITPVTTDSDGKYCFCNLLEGDYTIKVTPPAGYTPSTTQQADANTDTDDDSNIATDNGDGSYTSGTVELRFKGEPENETSPIDGSDTGCGCPVGDKSSNATVDFGFYIPNVHIGDLVWIEDDYDGDATTGTITYPPEGTVVTATALDGSTYTGATDANGHYDIEVPANDTYIVSVGTPENTMPTAGSDDNNVPNDNSENNKSHNGAGTTVTVGITDNLAVDFGFSTTASIGDLFWIDENANGIVDDGEQGYNGVIVTLLDADGNVLETQTTRNGPDGKPGYYLFEGLRPGKAYQVHFDYSNVSELDGYVYSPIKGGNNSNKADYKGFTVPVIPQAGELILTVDAGINCGCTKVASDSGDAMNLLTAMMMILMTLSVGWLFLKHEEDTLINQKDT